MNGLFIDSYERKVELVEVNSISDYIKGDVAQTEDGLITSEESSWLDKDFKFKGEIFYGNGLIVSEELNVTDLMECIEFPDYPEFGLSDVLIALSGGGFKKINNEEMICNNLQGWIVVLSPNMKVRAYTDPNSRFLLTEKGWKWI